MSDNEEMIIDDDESNIVVDDLEEALPKEEADVEEESEEESESEDEDEPLTVLYCTVCSLPHEYCSYGPSREKCKTALEKQNEKLFKKIWKISASGGDNKGEKKKQTRGGKGLASKAAKQNQQVKGSKAEEVIITLLTRNKRKFVTQVAGLGALGIDLKKASKTFAGRFAASSSITGDEIQITGDHTADIGRVILDKFKQVDKSMIKMKKSK